MRINEHNNIKLEQYIDIVGRQVDKLLHELTLSGLNRDLILLSVISIAQSELDTNK